MSQAKSVLLGTLLFFIPLFFLTTTQEFFLTNKLYLLAFGALGLLALSTVGIMVSQRISWRKSSFDAPLSFFLLASAISIIFLSPNKVSAVLNQNFGLLLLLSLAVITMYLEKSSVQKRLFEVLKISAFILALFSIFFFFQPFKNATLSPFLQFLRNPVFTPLGGSLDLVIFLGFFLVVGLSEVFIAKKRQSTFDWIALIVITIATGLTVLRILRPVNEAQALLLPPFDVSWYAAVDILKNPLNALFGVGLDNYAGAFARAKNVLYNQTPLWTVNSFNVSRSGLLHIFTETGLLGFTAFVLVLFTGFQFVRKSENRNVLFSAAFLYTLAILLFFPVSLVVFFLFFVALSLAPKEPTETQQFNLGGIMPLYLFVVVLFAGILGGLFYLLGRSYGAEMAFRRSFVGLIRNNAKELYDNQRQAVILNPYIERFRINFAQTNLLIATNIAQRARPAAEGEKAKQLTAQERQTITQAIQASIQEAKAAVALNPQKASNWQNLAVIYRNLLNAAQGADVWTISSYQRAVVLDPNNPIYRLNLGGVYYALRNYPEAIRIFEQAVVLKPNWANGHYNLAWAFFQNKTYERAIQSMQNVLKLVDKERNKEDYQKVLSELEEFKQKLPKDDSEATGEGELTLPQQPEPQLSPKVELPQSASPEAR